MDRGAHACPEVGRAGVQVAVLVVEQEVPRGLLLDRVPDGFNATSQSLKDAFDVAA